VKKLSAVMIVKNEEAMLGRCLESIKDMDEVIVLDTGSDDNTGAIARMYPNVNYLEGVYKWADNFAEARNKALSYSTGDWNFIIDADEYLEPGGISKLRNFIKSAKCRVVDIPSREETDRSVHYLPRLFVNDKKILYNGAIHNHLNTLPDGGKLDVFITYGHSPAHDLDPDRSFRILKKEVDKNRTCTRERFYLAREYWYRNDWITALYHYDEYLKVGNFWAEVADAWLMKARCLFYLWRGDEARDACLQAIKLNANFQEAMEFMAEMCGPGNKMRWLQISSTANNEGLLFIRVNNSPRVYYCDSMKTFGGAMIKHHGFERYNEELDIFKPTFFEGLYFEQDYDIFKKHLGPKTVFWNGSDISRLQVMPEWRKKLDGIKVNHYCHNKEDAIRLKSVGIEALVYPLFFGNLDNYPISYKQSDFPIVFTNAHPGREAEYGIPTILELADELPEIRFVIYGLDGKSYENIEYKGLVSEEQMDAEIRDYQGCIKLNPSGISQIVVKAGLMGQYPITINDVEGAFYAPDKQAMIGFLRSIKTQDKPNIKTRELYLKIYKKSQLELFGDTK
jgi:glycosyltransferase involved in cell wall biosynthesis